MAAGEDMRLDGPVSEELLFRITNYVVPLLYLCIPGTQPIAIHAEDRRKISLKGEPAVLTGLSNGIDLEMSLRRISVTPFRQTCA